MILALFTVLLWIIIIDNLILGIFLLIRAYQVKFSNLYSIGVGFVLFFVGLFGHFVIGFKIAFHYVFVDFGYFLIAIFTYLTFHRQKSHYRAKLFLYFLLILMILRITFVILSEISLTPTIRYSDQIISNCFLFLVFYWLGWSSFSTFKRIHNSEIAPWIILRYKIISIVSFLWPFPTLLGFFLLVFFVPWDTQFGDPSNFLSFIQFALIVIFSLIFIIGMIIAWIIPKSLKNYINRKKGYKPSKVEDLSENELMKLIKDQLQEGVNHGND